MLSESTGSNGLYTSIVIYIEITMSANLKVIAENYKVDDQIITELTNDLKIHWTQTKLGMENFTFPL